MLCYYHFSYFFCGEGKGVTFFFREGVLDNEDGGLGDLETKDMLKTVNEFLGWHD